MSTEPHDEPVVPEIVDAVPARPAPAPARGIRDLLTEVILLFPNLVKLLGRLLRDRRIPVRRKVVAGIILGYLVSPIDVVPDFIPFIGQVDDALLVAFALHHLMEGAGRDVVLELWDGSEDALDIIGAVVEWGAELVPAPIRRFLAR